MDDGLVQRVEHFLLGGVASRAAPAKVDLRRQDGERGAQVMGRIGDELFVRPQGAVQAADVVVHCRHDGRQFDRRLAGVEPLQRTGLAPQQLLPELDQGTERPAQGDDEAGDQDGQQDQVFAYGQAQQVVAKGIVAAQGLGDLGDGIVAGRGAGQGVLVGDDTHRLTAYRGLIKRFLLYLQRLGIDGQLAIAGDQQAALGMDGEENPVVVFVGKQFEGGRWHVDFVAAVDAGELLRNDLGRTLEQLLLHQRRYLFGAVIGEDQVHRRDGYGRQKDPDGQPAFQAGDAATRAG